jgi:predicted nucleotidyltransferase
MSALDINKKLYKILIKMAGGYYYQEVTEEYAPRPPNKNITTGQTMLAELCDEKTKGLELCKKKVTSHYVPPDMLAIKMLIETEGQKVDDLSSLSDEELISLKNKLQNQIENEENKGENNASNKL